MRESKYEMRIQKGIKVMIFLRYFTCLILAYFSQSNLSLASSELQENQKVLLQAHTRLFHSFLDKVRHDLDQQISTPTIFICYAPFNETEDTFQLDTLAFDLIRSGIKEENLYYKLRPGEGVTIHQHANHIFSVNKVIVVGSLELKEDYEKQAGGRGHTTQVIENLLSRINNKGTEGIIPLLFGGNFEDNFPQTLAFLPHQYLGKDYFTSFFDLLINLHALKANDNFILKHKANFDRQRGAIPQDMLARYGEKLRQYQTLQYKEDKARIEKILIGEETNSSSPTILSLPKYNTYFTGREEFLQNLNRILEQDSICVLAPSIVGIAGIGKSQVAKRYAYINKSKYDIIWWFNASTDLNEQYKSFAQQWNEHLNLWNQTRNKSDLFNSLELNIDPSQLINRLNDYLRRIEKNWLLIFDDADNESEIQGYFPQRDTSKNLKHIIATSQNSLGWSNSLKLKVFEKSESIKFLLKVSMNENEFNNIESLIVPYLNYLKKQHKNLVRDNNSLKVSSSLIKKLDENERKIHVAYELSSLLGDFPLALAQAASYLKTHPMPCEQYMKLFESRRKMLWERESQLLEKDRLPLDQYNKDHIENAESIIKKNKATIDVVIGLSLEAIGKNSNIASTIVNFCSLMNKENISDDLLKELISEYSENSVDLDFDFPDAISELNKHSILQSNESNLETRSEKTNDTYSIHELVQIVTKDKISKDEEAKFLGIIINKINSKFINNTIDVNAIYALNNPYLLGHMVSVYKNAKIASFINQPLLDLGCYIVDIYSHAHAQYRTAQFYACDLEDICKSNFNLYKPEKLNTLIGILKSQNECAFLESINTLKKAIENFEKSKEAKSKDESKLFDYFIKHNFIAQDYLSLGDLINAQIWWDKAKRISEENPTISKALLYYVKGWIFMAEGKYQEALELVDKSYETIKQEIGELNSTIYTIKSRRIEILFKMGNLSSAYEEAVILYRDAKDFFGQERESLEKNIPWAQVILAACQKDKDPKKSEELIFEALYKLEELYKSKDRHPDQAFAHIILGEIYEHQNMLEDALNEYLKAEKIYDKITNKKEIDNFSILYNNIFRVALKLNDIQKAKLYLDAHISNFGEQHFRTLEMKKFFEQKS